MLTHDELFTVGEVKFGEPKRMTWKEMNKEFPCHFFVLKDVVWTKRHDVESAVVVKVSFGNKLICQDYIMKHDGEGCIYWYTASMLDLYGSDYVANEIYRNYGSDRSNDSYDK